MTARQFRRIRTKVLRITQEALAEKLGYYWGVTVSRKECGHRAITKQDGIMMKEFENKAERNRARAQRR